MKGLRRLLRHLLGRSGFRRALAGLMLAFCSLVTTAALASGGGKKPVWDNINWFSFDWSKPPAVGWFILDFILFAWILVHYGKKPIREAFAQRHQKIKLAIEEATRAHESASSRYEDYRGKLANVEEEAAQHVTRGREDGALERDEIVKSGEEYTERLRKDSKAVTEQELEKARLRLRRDVVKQVLELTQETLQRELTEKDQKRLLEEAIAELEQTPTTTTSKPRAQSRPRAGGVA